TPELSFCGCAMKPSILLILLLTLVAGYTAISAESDDEHVELAVLSEKTWDQYAPNGKEVDAIYGDVVLRNPYLTAVIAEPLASRHANMSVREVGGCLIDFTPRHHQSDQLVCFYPGRKGIA